MWLAVIPAQNSARSVWTVTLLLQQLVVTVWGKGPS